MEERIQTMKSAIMNTLVEHKATVYEAQAILSDLRREVLWQVEADKRKIEEETPVK